MSLTSTLPPIRLLITDREPASREVLLSLFRAAPGFDSIKVVSPEEAIPQAALDRVHVVLLDVVRPHEISVKVCQGLRALSPSPIVIALATFADPKEEEALRDAGAAGYLLKEVHLEKLVDAIHQIVAHERAALDRSSSSRQR